MRSARPFLPLLFVAALLFAQLGGLTHGIAHSLAEQSQDQSLPHEQHCDLCAHYAQVGSVIGSSPVDLQLTAHSEETPFAFSPACRRISFAAFTARAPPYSA